MVTWRCSLAGYSVRFIPGRSGVQIPPPLPFLKKPKWTFSSVGQSSRLITGWSGVRVPEGPPFLLKHNCILVHSKSYTEEYPSLAEGIGLENRQGVTAAGVRIPLPPPFFERGVEQLVARRAHNPEVGGSSPPSATIKNIGSMV